VILSNPKEESMRRFRATLLGGFLVFGLLTAPGAVSVAAGVSGPVTIVTGWTCHPNGSGVISGPSTTISRAVLFPSRPMLDSISCLFQSLTGSGLTPAPTTGSQFGGDCYYHESVSIGIEFAHRIYIVSGNTAILLCWDGSLAPG
jgi:hypothetical protein